MTATPDSAYGSCPWARFYSSTVSPALRWTSRSASKEAPINMRHLLFAIIWLCSFTIYAELPALIPREVLFGNPERADPQISPDGSQRTWLAPDKNGVLNVWVSAMDGANPHPVTNETDHPIHHYRWAADGKHILYLHDNNGDERPRSDAVPRRARAECPDRFTTPQVSFGCAQPARSELL